MPASLPRRSSAHRRADRGEQPRARPPGRTVGASAEVATQGVEEAFFVAVDEEARSLATRTREECRALRAPDLGELFDEGGAGGTPLYTARTIDAGR